MRFNKKEKEKIISYVNSQIELMHEEERVTNTHATSGFGLSTLLYTNIEKTETKRKTVFYTPAAKFFLNGCCFVGNRFLFEFDVDENTKNSIVRNHGCFTKCVLVDVTRIPHESNITKMLDEFMGKVNLESYLNKALSYSYMDKTETTVDVKFEDRYEATRGIW